MATYYFSQTTDNGYAVGVDTNDGLTKGAPLLTLAKWNTEVSGGDHTLIFNGVDSSPTEYAFPDALIVTARPNLIFSSEVLKGAALKPASRITTSGTTGVQFKDLVLRPGTDGVVYSSGDPLVKYLNVKFELTNDVEYGILSDALFSVEGDWEVVKTPDADPITIPFYFEEGSATGQHIIDGGTVTGDYSNGVMIGPGEENNSFFITDTTLDITLATSEDYPGIIHLACPVNVVSGVVMDVDDNSGDQSGIYFDVGYFGAPTKLHILDNTFTGQATALTTGIAFGSSGDKDESSADMYLKNNTLTKVLNPYELSGGIDDCCVTASVCSGALLAMKIEYGKSKTIVAGMDFGECTSGGMQVNSCVDSTFANITMVGGGSTFIFMTIFGTTSGCIFQNLHMVVKGDMPNILIDLRSNNSATFKNNNIQVDDHKSFNLDDTTLFRYQGSNMSARQWAGDVDSEFTINGFKIPATGDLTEFVGLIDTGSDVVNTSTNPILDLDGDAFPSPNFRGALPTDIPNPEPDAPPAPDADATGLVTVLILPK